MPTVGQWPPARTDTRQSRSRAYRGGNASS
jgi:hypothetical protein